jgi:hypothetical protein
VSCRHRWKPYADAERIWTVCIDCGAERHVGTHRERLADNLRYIFQDFRSSDAKPSDEHTQREPAEDATGGTAGPGPAPD